jgi:hypothetical protein
MLESGGAVAQLGERRLCKPQVVGSSPISSTKLSWCGLERRDDDASRVVPPAPLRVRRIGGKKP